MDVVKVKAKSGYGRTYLHPECGLTKLLAQLRKTENLTTENIKALIDIGYSVEYSGNRVKELEAMGAKYIM